MSVAVDGFPNMFQALGPNAGVGAGNLLLIMERQVDYAVSATLKIQRERSKSMDAKPEAVNDFETWIEVSLCRFFCRRDTDIHFFGQSYFPKVSLLESHMFTVHSMAFVILRRCLELSVDRGTKAERKTDALLPYGQVVFNFSVRCCR